MLLRPAAAVALALIAALEGGCRPDAPFAVASDAPPTRIVAGSIFAAEVLLDLVPRDRLAGVHVLAADARYSLVADRLDGLTLLAPEPEALLAVTPDLVIIDAFTRPETVALLTAAGVRLLRPPAVHDFDGIWANVRLLGDVCGCRERAEQLVAVGMARLAALQMSAHERSPWRLLNLDGALHTHGRGSPFDAVVAAAGAKNLGAEEGAGPFRKLDIETVLAWPADALVLAASSDDLALERQWITQHPGLRLMQCVRRDRLLFVPSSLLGSTSHHLVGAAEHIAQQLQRWGQP